LELIEAVGGLKSGAPLQTRVGIATGLVVVGDLIGTGSAQEQTVVGETPNLAARVQGIAEPNTVVIAESTRKLLGDLFDLEDLGAKNLKGIAGTVRAWAALRTSSVESRFEALRTATTPLVGRDEEIELLMRRWTQAKAGDGQREPPHGPSRPTGPITFSCFFMGNLPITTPDAILSRLCCSRSDWNRLGASRTIPQHCCRGAYIGEFLTTGLASSNAPANYSSSATVWANQRSARHCPGGPRKTATPSCWDTWVRLWRILDISIKHNWVG